MTFDFDVFEKRQLMLVTLATLQILVSFELTEPDQRYGGEVIEAKFYFAND